MGTDLQNPPVRHPGSGWLILIINVGTFLFVLVSASFETPWYKLGPIAIIFVFTVWARRRGRRNPAALPGLADQAYFLGYLATIAAFVTIGVKVWRSGGSLSQPQDAILMGVIGLCSTVAGLTAMNYLKSCAPTAGYSLSAELPGVIERLDEMILAFAFPPEINQRLTAIKAALEGISELGNTSADARTSLEQLTQKLKQLRNDIADFSEGVADANQRIHDFVDNVKQMRGVLDDFVRVVETKLTEEWRT